MQPQAERGEAALLHFFILFSFVSLFIKLNSVKFIKGACCWFVTSTVSTRPLTCGHVLKGKSVSATLCELGRGGIWLIRWKPLQTFLRSFSSLSFFVYVCRGTWFLMMARGCWDESSNPGRCRFPKSDGGLNMTENFICKKGRDKIKREDYDPLLSCCGARSFSTPRPNPSAFTLWDKCCIQGPLKSSFAMSPCVLPIKDLW